MLEVTSLSAAYGKREVLRDVSFCAGAGELVAVAGKNGAGKTTLFRAILGNLAAYSGEICVDGESIKNAAPRLLAKKIAYIPQSSPAVFNFEARLVVMTGRNAEINRFRGPGRAEEEAAEAALRELGIEHLARRGCAELSGGERQLVLLARALAQNAPIIIMDEPLANLDYGNQIRVLQKMRRLCRAGFLVLFSTHSPEHALGYASKALVLKDGGVAAFGAPGAVLDGAMLEKIYGVAVSVRTIEHGGRVIPVCLPDGEE